MENIKLKPCPFCGGEATMRINYSVRYSVDYSYVKCVICGGQGKSFSSQRLDERPKARARAAMAWNSRYQTKED